MLWIVVRQGKEKNMNGGGHDYPQRAGDPRRQAV